MVQVLPYVPGFGEQLAQALGNAAGNIGAGYFEKQNREKLNAKDSAIIEQLNNPALSPMEKIAIVSKLSPEKQKNVSTLLSPVLKEETKSKELFNQLGRFAPQFFGGMQQANPNAVSPMGEESPAQQGQQSQFDLLNAPDEMLQLLTAIPALKAPSEAILDSRKASRELTQKKESEGRGETAKFRQELAESGLRSEKAIANKEHLIDVIETGNIDDPTYVQFADLVPFKLGQRLLSPETTEYRSGLFDEYSAIKNTFPGATRVEEIKIFTEKLAGLFLTDEQKKQVLRAGIKTLQADKIRAEEAAKIEKENPGIGVLQFQEQLSKRTQPRLNKLLNEIADDYSKVVKEAESTKSRKLDASKESDREIAKQILEEAKGDKKKARAIAKKRGYEF